MDSLAALRALDPAQWGLPLSAENARRTWADSLADLEAGLGRTLLGQPPQRVLVIASANVYTAPLPWMAHLALRGVPVRVKPARGHLAAVSAMAACLPGVEVAEWRGGDVEREAVATADVDAVIAFGGAAALDAIGARLPAGVRWFPFGPRFGVSVVERLDARTVLDHALYDGRGCMSPAAIFVRQPGADLDELAASLAADAERLLPRGGVDAAEAVAIRARLLLARALGAGQEGPGWAVVRLPAERFTPLALPRVLTLHPWEDLARVEAAVGPWAGQLGSVASDLPEAELRTAPTLWGAARRCAPGELQRPPADGWHEGRDVLGELWGARPG